MHRLQLHYALSRQSHPAQVRNPLIDLLQAVSEQGSISAGARSLGLSYRHVWGELKRWEAELGNELLVWEKGQSARLSEFGAKLLWAEQRAQARLAPQIEALQNELERAFAVAFDPHAHVATLYASHDHALGVLREYALTGQETHPTRADPNGPVQVHLDIQFCGSVDAIRGLNEGRCELAGFHTLQHPEPGSLAERTYKPLLQPGQHKIIGFAKRMQGLMVAKGNPGGLQSLQQVSGQQARWINRNLGTGTRVVLDELLGQVGMSAHELLGYDDVALSQTAAAHAVATGRADAALGTAAAALAQGLDFVPLVEESYHLVCLKTALGQPAIAALLNILQTPHWQQALGATTGYTPSHCGEVLSLREVLPWWSYAHPKRTSSTGS